MTGNIKKKIVDLCDRAQQNPINNQLLPALNNYCQALEIAQDKKLTKFAAVILNYIGDIWQLLGEVQEIIWKLKRLKA